MGKKLKKKASKKKKTSQKNYDNGRIDWGLGIRSSSDSESDEDELSGMNVVLMCDDLYCFTTPVYC